MRCLEAVAVGNFSVGIGWVYYRMVGFFCGARVNVNVSSFHD